MCDGHLEMDYEDRFLADEPEEPDYADESSFCELCGHHTNLMWSAWDNLQERDVEVCPSCRWHHLLRVLPVTGNRRSRAAT